MKITTDAEYRAAVLRWFHALDADPGTPEFEEGVELAKALDEYEDANPVEA